VDLPGLTATDRGATLKADPFAQLKLLDVQELDSKLDALRHQAANLPEVAELKEVTANRAGLDDRVRDLRVQVDDLTREQRKADADVEQVKARRVRDQQRLESGAVSHPKELERLQHELVSLDRRIGELEDTELEVMERLEAAQQEVATLEQQLVETDRRIEELTVARDDRMTGLREQAATVRRDRAAKVEDMPAELVALYDRLREQKDGVGAALLRARRCGGCSLELNSAELADVAKKPVDDVVRCDECGRILVRTGESGL